MKIIFFFLFNSHQKDIFTILYYTYNRYQIDESVHANYDGLINETGLSNKNMDDLLFIKNDLSDASDRLKTGGISLLSPVMVFVAPTGGVMLGFGIMLITHPIRHSIIRKRVSKKLLFL
ncbi:MAG: hypothetical protein LBT66_03340 [Methanobrevibacter sp.]|jgi:hypothetical protein|nr:hypothetical protein [Candidatus Methanovirga meridionalis]